MGTKIKITIEELDYGYKATVKTGTFSSKHFASSELSEILKEVNKTIKSAFGKTLQ